MSLYVSNCPGCLKIIGVPRPGSCPDNDEDTEESEESDILTKCPFCDKDISSNAGYELKEPAVVDEPVDLLSVD